MLTFGPVAEAAHGGHSNPAFDLLIGLSVLALTWVGYGKGKSSGRVTIWAALGVSAICGVFIVSGVVELFR
jgi:VIT1/CCC1 family predicted Fe2+/Mn2+ transporter